MGATTVWYPFSVFVVLGHHHELVKLCVDSLLFHIPLCAQKVSQVRHQQPANHFARATRVIMKHDTI